MKIYQQISNIAKILLLAILATACHAKDLSNIGFDDWIVSNTCSQNSNILCNGYYKQPNYIITNDTTKQPITITSDEANFISKGTAKFIGNVVATQGVRMIYADKALVEHNPTSGELEKITATGHVKIMQPGLRVDGTKAVANIDTDRKTVTDAVYRIYARHARGTAKSLIVDGQNKMILSPGSYTTCAPDSNAWCLKASETKFNSETGRGQAWHAKLYLKEIPIFYFPYVSFPIDKKRHTGFLQPSYENSSLNGDTFIAPFYWNIAPNYDSKITTNYMSLRGWKFDTLWRYLNTFSESSLLFDFLPHDRAYQAMRNNLYADPGFMQSTDQATVLRRNDLKPRDFRYKIGFKNTTNLYKNLVLTVDYNDASDGDYLYDFYNSNWNYTNNLASTIYALQRATLQYNSVIGSLRYQLEQYKTFHVVNGPSGTQQLSKLPEITFNSATAFLPAGTYALMNAHFSQFRPSIIPDNSTLLSYGHRFHMRPALGLSISEPGWYFMPRVQLNYLQYTDLHISPTDINAGVSQFNSNLMIPMYDLKTGLVFERDTSFRYTQLFQTLEPQIYYLYVPYKDQHQLPNFDSGVIDFDYNQVFRDNRYSGLDRVAAANQFGLGLATRFFKLATGVEQGMLAVGRILYMRDKVLQLNETYDYDQRWSPWAIRARFNIDSQYSLEANLVRNSRATETASLQFQYLRNTSQVINFGYEYIRSPEVDDLTGQYQSDIKQINLSSAWEFTPMLRLLGKFTYDLRFHRQLDVLAGLEYHTCCTALRAIWTKTWLPEVSTTRSYNNSIRLQFIFKGLGGGLGNAESSYIEREIPGYKATTGY